MEVSIDSEHRVMIYSPAGTLYLGVAEAKALVLALSEAIEYLKGPLDFAPRIIHTNNVRGV